MMIFNQLTGLSIYVTYKIEETKRDEKYFDIQFVTVLHCAGSR